MSKLSIITCLYNEEENIKNYFSHLLPVLTKMNIKYEIIFVNDGSQDATLKEIGEALLKYTKLDVTVVSLSRNFGKEIALTVGLDYSQGQVVMPLDADLQEPVEMIPIFYQKWEEGYMNIIGVKKDRSYETFFKGGVTKIYYRIMSSISRINIIPNSGDFRMLDRRVVNELVKLRETNRFMKGIYAYPGFNFTTIEYSVKKREKSRTKWSFLSLWKLSLDGMFGFSSAAIKIWTYVGGFIILAAVIYSTFLLVKAAYLGVEVPGYITTIILIVLFGGTQLVAIGILGEYVARIFEQVKGRPLYVVEKVMRQGENE